MPASSTYATPFDIIGGVADRPMPGELLLRVVLARDSMLLPAGLGDSRAYCTVAPTAPTVMPIFVNGTKVAQIDFAPGQHRGTFTSSYDVLLEKGDIMEVYGPTVSDATFSGPAFTISGRVEGLASAARLAVARTISLAGDASGSTTFDGSANRTIYVTLTNSGVVPGTYSRVVVDAKGRVVAGAESAPVSPEVIRDALGYTPANRAGDTFTGPVTFGTATATLITADLFTGTLNGTATRANTANIATLANRLAVSRYINLLGEAQGSALFDGTANANITVSLAPTGVTPGTYNQVVVDAKGRVVAASVVTTPPPTITLNGDATGSGTSTIALTLVPTGVLPGTYNTVTVDAKGRVVSGAYVTPTPQVITLTGDASGSGSSTIALTLAPTGVTPGTYNQVVVDAKGRVVAASSVPVTPPSITLTGDASGSGTSTIELTLANTGVAPGVYNTVTVDAKGRVIAGTFTPPAAPTITLTGDATGSGTGTIPLTLTTTGVAPGTYDKVVVDAKGRVVAGSNPPPAPAPITLTGDATGSGTSTIALTLAPTGVTPGTYNTVTVDAKGRVIAASNTPTIVSVALTGDVTGISNSGGTISATLAATGVSPGTYNTVVVDAKGRVVYGSNADIGGGDDTLATVTARGATTSTAISITNATASTSKNTGALVVSGGVGIGKELTVGGDIRATGRLQIDYGGSGSTSDFVNFGSRRGFCFYMDANAANAPTTDSFRIYNNVAMGTNTDSGLLFEIADNGRTRILTTLDSTGSDSGALVVSGGLGVGRNFNVKGAVGVGRQDLGNVVGSRSINIANGNYVTATIMGATIFSFTGAPNANATSLILRLTNGGSATISWPSTVKWPGGFPPNLTASGTDVLLFLSDDGGATWRGMVGMKDVR